MPWSSGFTTRRLSDIPTPDSFSREWPPVRCYVWLGTVHRIDTAEHVGRFIAEEGYQGKSMGCPWHQMDAPRHVLAAAIFVFEQYKAKPVKPTLQLLQALGVMDGLSDKDKVSVFKFVDEPIKIADTGQLFDGSHRVCALRNAGFADDPEVLLELI